MNELPLIAIYNKGTYKDIKTKEKLDFLGNKTPYIHTGLKYDDNGNKDIICIKVRDLIKDFKEQDKIC